MSRCATCGSRSRHISHEACRPGDAVETAVVPAPEVPGYTVFATLARGGFGTVFRARRGRVDVALKVAHRDPDAIARLVREGEILARLDLPCTPRLLDAGVAGEAHFLAMELIDAPTLGDRMVELPAGVPELVSLGGPIADALHALHERGVVHRDVTPENILVGRDRTTLIDFGLARSPGDPALTGTGAGAGTVTYLAPEQIAGDVATPAADVYNLGVILYELATAFPPFHGADSAVRVAHQSHRPPPPSVRAPVASELEATILACLAKDPTRRPTAAEVGASLRRLSDRSARPSRGASAAVVAAASTRVPCAVLACTSHGSVTMLAAVVARHRGELVGPTADRAWAAVFSPLEDGQPVERALLAAEELRRAGLVEGTRIARRELVFRNRPGGARRLLARAGDLVAIADELGAAAPPSEARGSSAPPRDGTVPLIGRDLLLEQLSARMRASGCVVEVLVGAGAGATRVSRELATRHGAIALTLVEPAPGVPHDGARALAEALTATTSVALLEVDERAAIASLLARPADADVVARLLRTPGSMRAAISRGLVALCSQRPGVAIVLDDAHHADAALRDALRMLEAAPGATRVLSFTRRPMLDPQADRAELGPLGHDDTAGLCRELLRPAIDVPAAVVSRIAARSGGLPRDLADLCRALHDRGAIRRRARGEEYYVDGAVLDEIDAAPLGARELAGLDPHLRAYAAALAVLEPGFSAGDAAAILESAPSSAALVLDTGVALARLQARGLLEQTVRDGRAVLRLVPRVRSALAAELPTELRRALHAAAAAHHAPLAAHDREHRARVAPHAIAIGDLARGVAILLELAGEACDAHDYLGAELLYARVIELTADPAIELDALRGRGAMRFRLARYEDALADHARARALAVASPTDIAGVLLDEATTYDWMGELAKSAASVAAARDIMATVPCDAPQLELLRARLQLAEARSTWRMTGVSPRAVELLERALAATERAGERGYEDRMAALVILVYVLPSIDRLDDAERVAEQAIALCEQRGDRRHLAIVFNNRQLLSMRRGLHDRAIADLERAERISFELGIPIQRYRTRLSLAYINKRLGRLSAARTHAEIAHAVEAYGAAAGGHQSAGLMLVQILVSLGEREAARRIAATIRREALFGEEATMLSVLELALVGEDQEASWLALIDVVRRTMPQWLPDLHEQRALAAVHRGARTAARSSLEAAIETAAQYDPVALDRLHQRLVDLAS